MGLFDKVAAHKEAANDNSKPQVVFRDGTTPRRRNGRPANQTGANEHFKKMAESAKKEKIARKMNSVLGDENYKYIRKDGKTAGFERN